MKTTMFYEEPEPERAQATIIAPDILRIVANNSSKMTYHGTNTYIVKTQDGTFVIDPGPSEDVAHYYAILEAIGDNLAGILVSHHHSDHFGAAPALRAETGMPVYVFENFGDDAFEADGYLVDGDNIGGLTVHHTPGHASDHLCFSREDGVLFTGDHVMTWSSSIVSPPDGNMAEYCQQLARLVARDDTIYLPGHGPRLNAPKQYVSQLLANRMRRERDILKCISNSPRTAEAIAALLYKKADPHLAKAAVRNVLAHLEKLKNEDAVNVSQNLWIRI